MNLDNSPSAATDAAHLPEFAASAKPQRTPAGDAAASRQEASGPNRAKAATEDLQALQARVATARILAPINNWEFAERVWAGLRPHLRARLWVLEALRSRETHATQPREMVDEDCARLAQIATEIRAVEDDVEQALKMRSSLREFSALLADRLAPCLTQMEQLQSDLREHHAA